MLCQCSVNVITFDSNQCCVNVAYLGGQMKHVGAVEGRVEAAHLIEDAPQGPDICFLPIGLALDQLRAAIDPSYPSS